METTPKTTAIVFGTFDLFHHGHLRILQRAAVLADRLVVGVSSDALNVRKKRKVPVHAQNARLAVVGALRCVDAVFLEESLQKKREYLATHRADVLVMGDDWAGAFDDLQDVCRVVYLPRTPEISTSSTLAKIVALQQAPKTSNELVLEFSDPM